ncbi:Zinc finger protein 62 [Folsomia candida]|uniref:Zinc finger protein 62 n=1 Tax=Folsomia candida TaxID=158441 RepID=A0A226E753_FOLCA|nr:Zinc finger protein 62 [Folsomia candida]
MPLPKAYNSCYFCNKTWPRKTPSIIRLSNHMRLHTIENPFKCSFSCKKSFKTYTKLVAHRSRHEKKGQKPWKCTQCDASFKSKSILRSHVIDVHTTERPFKCTLCPSSYKRTSQLKLHLKDHDPFNRYPCPKCSLILKTRRNLTLHVEKVHGGRNSKCYFCKKNFTRVGLIDHIRIHTEEAVFQCRTCPRTCLHYSSRVQHEGKEHGEKKTDLLAPCYRGKECPLCQRMCKDTHALSVHMRIHTGEKPYTCPRADCGKQFSTSSSLMSHAKYHINNPGGQHKCRFCPKTFQTASRATCHERNLHIETWRRPKKCPSCPKVYPSFSALARHQLIHLKEPPFKCSQCTKGFFYQTDYSRHMKNVHKLEKIMIEVKKQRKSMFECKICSKTYPNFGTFVNHQDLHQDPTHPCANCPRKFHTVHSLRKHNRTEHAGPRYKCYFCVKFPQYFDAHAKFRDHMIRHTQEQEFFECNKCNKSFKRFPYLNHHMEICGRKFDTKSELFPCDKCPEKVFYSKHQLYSHTYKVHTKTWRRKTCPFSALVLRDSYSLAIHLRTHVGEKPHTCDICGMRFTQKGTLVEHLRRHEDRKKGIKFPCKVCHKPYISRASLAVMFEDFIRAKEKIGSVIFVTSPSLARNP